MQSKTLFFNQALFRKNLARFWPMWGMASFLGALFPLALLLEILREPELVIKPLEFTRAYYEVLTYGVPIISLAYSILCAMAVWNYLYNARSVGLMHTLPIRREGLFLTNFLSGMAMQLIPYVVTGGLIVLISLAYGSFDPVGVLVTILGVLGESFFYFSTATLVAFCVGNIFALPALYFLLHFLAVMMDWLVSTFAQGFIFGLSGNYSGAVEFLSPTVYFMSQVGVNGIYEEQFERAELTGTGYYTNVLVDVQLENGWMIAVYALVGVVCLALAYALYRKRRSESAGDVVAVGWMKPVFRYGGAALAALLGGIALYELFWRNFQYGEYYDVVPMIVCMLIAGAIGYYGASMLLAKSLKVFRKSWKGLGLVAVGCVAVCCVLHFDALGIAARVPEIREIKSVELYAANNHYELFPGEEDELLEQVRQVHMAITEDAQYIMATQEMWYNTYESDDENIVYSQYVRINYELTNGQTVTRRYNIPMARIRMEQGDTYDALLDQLVNSREMKVKRLHLNDSRYQPDGGYLYVEATNNSYDLSDREAAAILEAVGKDAAAGTWGNYNWFSNDRANQYAMDLSISYTWVDEQTDRTYGDSVSIVLRPEMKNTIACMKELNLVKSEDLKTYLQLYPQEFISNYTEYEDAYAVPTGTESAAVIYTQTY